MKEDSHQVITLYYGEDVKEDEAAALCEKIAEKYPDCDVDYHSGGQPFITISFLWNKRIYVNFANGKA